MHHTQYRNRNVYVIVQLNTFSVEKTGFHIILERRVLNRFGVGVVPGEFPDKIAHNNLNLLFGDDLFELRSVIAVLFAFIVLDVVVQSEGVGLGAQLGFAGVETGL